MDKRLGCDQPIVHLGDLVEFIKPCELLSSEARQLYPAYRSKSI